MIVTKKKQTERILVYLKCADQVDDISRIPMGKEAFVSVTQFEDL